MSQIRVGIGEYAVARGPVVMRTAALGSCVAIALHGDGGSTHAVGALAHILLPHESLTAGTHAPGKCAATALPVMLRRMRELGVTERVVARLVGGASMFPTLLTDGHESMGSRNVSSARAACAAHRVPIVGEDVGGHHGRSLVFDVEQGDLLVTSVLRDDVHL